METEKISQSSKEVEHEEAGKYSGIQPVLADEEIEPVVTAKTWVVVAVGSLLGILAMLLINSRFYH